MWVLAPLRHRQFFSLAEANAALAEKIAEWNNRRFAPPREGSRRSLFEAIERDKLQPLPTAPFVVGRWLVARVNIGLPRRRRRPFLFRAVPAGASAARRLPDCNGGGDLPPWRAG
jgi:hypothetical protein